MMKKMYLMSLMVLLCGFAIPSYAVNEKAETIDKHEGITITVNINSATVEELSTLLSGVGKKKAQLIIDYRTENGPFKSADALSNVKGIGPALLEKNRSRIRL